MCNAVCCTNRQGSKSASQGTIGSCQKPKNEPTGEHFNLPGHSIEMLKAAIIEKCSFETKTYQQQREQFFIHSFQTKYNGMNRKL